MLKADDHLIGLQSLEQRNQKLSRVQIVKNLPQLLSVASKPNHLVHR